MTDYEGIHLAATGRDENPRLGINIRIKALLDADRAEARANGTRPTLTWRAAKKLAEAE